MNRILILILILILSVLNSPAQVYIQGILKSDYEQYSARDTAVFAGAKEEGKDNTLHYILKSSNKLIPAKQVQLLVKGIDFWEFQQFYYVSGDILSTGWQIEKRKELEQKTLDLLAKLNSESRIYEDKYAEDYLQRLIQKIHYPEFSKGRAQFFNVKILNSDKKICYAFDNGSILISSQLIADTENERELFQILTEAIGHILLNSNMKNIDDKASSEYRQLGAIYPEMTKRRINLIAKKYLSYYEKRATSEPYLLQRNYFNSIASVISYTAWQEYYNQQYDKSLLNVSKLVSYDLANSSDYLLNAKIYLRISNTSPANQKALTYLKKAADFQDQLLPEVYSEMGIVYLREEQYQEAKESFKKFHAMVVEVKDEEKQKWALKMINTCNVFLQLEDTKLRPADSLDVEVIEIAE